METSQNPTFRVLWKIALVKSMAPEEEKCSPPSMGLNIGFMMTYLIPETKILGLSIRIQFLSREWISCIGLWWEEVWA